MMPAWQKLNSPQKLWASLYLIWALDALLLLAAMVGVQVHRAAMKTVGKDTAPSIIAAQHIKSALADMDANAANELLLAKPDQVREARQAYENRRREAATALIEAARNITYGEAEQKPIEALQVGIGTYEVGIQKARDLHESEDPDFVAAYRAAANGMDQNLLPEADRLDQANNDELEKTYHAQARESVASVLFILAAAAGLVAALVAVQKFLSRRTHRTLNPILLLATLVTLGFILYTLQALAGERRNLKIANEDAFTSIHALWRARAVAYSANADESRYLLDTAQAAEYAQQFQRKVQTLTRLHDAELSNITFEGEREAAEAMVAAFNEYLKIDSEIRRLEQGGRHAEALELCIGRKEGESNWAFDQFDKALGKTLSINQEAFDNSVAQGFAVLSYFELKASIAAVAIALLAFFGLLKRIQEYS